MAEHKFSIECVSILLDVFRLTGGKFHQKEYEWAALNHNRMEILSDWKTDRLCKHMQIRCVSGGVHVVIL